MRKATEATRQAVLSNLRYSAILDNLPPAIKAAFYDIANYKSCSRQRENVVREVLGLAPLQPDKRQDVRPRIDANLYNEVMEKFGSVRDALIHAVDE